MYIYIYIYTSKVLQRRQSLLMPNVCNCRKSQRVIYTHIYTHRELYTRTYTYVQCKGWMQWGGPGRPGVAAGAGGRAMISWKIPAPTLKFPRKSRAPTLQEIPPKQKTYNR